MKTRILALLLVLTVGLSSVRADAASGFCEGLMNAAATVKYMVVNKPSALVSGVVLPITVVLVCTLHSCVGKSYEKEYKNEVEAKAMADQRYEESRNNRIETERLKAQDQKKLEKVLTRRFGPGTMLTREVLLEVDENPSDEMVIIDDSVYALIDSELHVFRLNKFWRDSRDERSKETPDVRSSQHLQTFVGGPIKNKLTRYSNAVVIRDSNATNDYKNALQFFYAVSAENYGGYIKVDYRTNQENTEIFAVYSIDRYLLVHEKISIGGKRFSVLVSLTSNHSSIEPRVSSDRNRVLLIAGQNPETNTTWLESEQPLEEIYDDYGILVGLKDSNGRVIFKSDVISIHPRLKTVLRLTTEGKISADWFEQIKKNKIKDVVLTNGGGILYVLSGRSLVAFRLFFDPRGGDVQITSATVVSQEVRPVSTRSRLIPYGYTGVVYYGVDDGFIATDYYLHASADLSDQDGKFRYGITKRNPTNKSGTFLTALYVVGGDLVYQGVYTPGGSTGTVKMKSRLSVVKSGESEPSVTIELGDAHEPLVEIKNDKGETIELQDPAGKTVYKLGQ